MYVIDVLGWDNGFGFEKFFSGKENKSNDQKKVMFPSSIHTPRKQDFTDESNYTFNKAKMRIIYNDQEYFVGKLALSQGGSENDRKISNDKFKDQPALIKLIAGIELLAETKEKKIRIEKLGVGLNIQAYKELKGDYENTYTNKTIEYSIPNEGKKEIYINECICYPQGVGAYNDELLNLEGQATNEQLLDCVFGVIDVGDKTVDGFIVNEETDIIRDSVFGKNQGVMNAFRSVSSKLGNVPFNLIQKDYLQGKEETYYQKTHKIKEPCEKAFKDLANTIYDKIDFEWAEYIERVQIIFICGGGATILKEYFENLFQNKKVVVIDDPQFANARGYYKLSRL